MKEQFIDYSPRLEAENALLEGSANINNNHTGFSGSGFVDGFTQQGASTSFTVDIPESGEYNVTLRYANGDDNGNFNTRTLSLYVNGVDVRQTELPTTNDWKVWNNKTEVLNLQSGTNTIEYKFDSDDFGKVNLDYAWISKSSENGAIGTPIIDSGITLEIEKFVRIPDDSVGRPRMIGMTTHNDRLFVIEERDGHIYEIVDDSNGNKTTELFFDVGDGVNLNTGRNLNTSNLFHGGLRGIAFHPDFDRNGKFYTSLMEDRPTNPNDFNYLSDAENPISADSVVVEWTYDFNNNRVDPNSYRQVLRIGMPVFDHPIKEITFNPYARSGDSDYGLLYIAHGDGSVESATAGGGQNQDGLGKILRINPLQNGSDSYTIPNDNPFVGNSNMLDEVYSFGHRNPHTISFALDRQNNSYLIAGEPGRDNVEEINLIVPGGNYGWSDREGTFVHVPEGGGIVEGVEPLPENEAENNYIYPVAQWGRVAPPGGGFVGQAVAGGYVIDNGSELDGQYISGDFPTSGRIFQNNFNDILNAITQLDPSDPNRDEPSELTQAPLGNVSLLFDHDNNPNTPSLVRSNMKDILDDEPTYTGNDRADIRFGQGDGGELYILNKHNGYIYLVTNSIGTNVIEGTSNNDTLNGSPNSDIIKAFGGNDLVTGDRGFDKIFGGSGNDDLSGNTGKDILTGGNGNDSIQGDGGSDRLFGNDGNDVLNGGSNNDTIFGGSGNDLILGSFGDDTLRGIQGRDTLNGGSGNDLLNGGSGNDLLTSGKGNDTLSGGIGNDSLNGGNGNDLLKGGNGDDLLVGGSGNDTLTGNLGNDVFVIQSFSSGNRDVIRDFSNNIDRLSLSTGISFNNLNIVSSSSGNSTLIQDSSNNTLAVINGVDSSLIDRQDFI